MKVANFAGCTPAAILFSKVNETLSGYFDPITIVILIIKYISFGVT